MRRSRRASVRGVSSVLVHGYAGEGTLPNDAPAPQFDLDGGHLATLLTDETNLSRLGAPAGLTLDPSVDAHRSVLDELAEKLSFVDLETDAILLVAVAIGGVPVNVEVKPTVDSLTLTNVGAC